MNNSNLLYKKYLFDSIKLILKKKGIKNEKDEIVQELWGYILRGNIKQILSQTKSRTKMLLLSALHQESLLIRPGVIYFAPHYNTTYELWESYGQFERFGLKNHQEIKDQDARISSNVYTLFYQALDLKHSYHINIDIYLSDIIHNKKQLKVAILIWVPANPHFKLILKFDSDNTSEDIDLGKHGYQVILIKDREIRDNPKKVAQEIIEKLDF